LISLQAEFHYQPATRRKVSGLEHAQVRQRPEKFEPAPRDNGLKAGSHPSGIFGGLDGELPIALCDGRIRSDFAARFTVCGTTLFKCAATLLALAGAENVATSSVPASGAATASATPTNMPKMKFVLNTVIKSADTTAAITDAPPSRSLNEIARA
jgi:hypothetical protein